MTEASKNVLLATVREWAKFAADRDKFTAVALEVAAVARKTVQDSLMFLKSLNIDVECETQESMKLLGVPVVVEPVVEAVFPNVKSSVVLKCGGASRTIVINPNLTISAGGNPIAYDQLKKGLPASFEMNSAEFVRDAFLNVARTGGKTEEK